MASHGNSNESLITQGCGCLFALVGLVSFIGFIYVFVAQPQPVWGSISNFINGGVTYEVSNSDKNPEQIQNEITEQVKNVGTNDVYIDEKDLTVLLRQRFKSFRDATLEVEDGKAKVFWKTSASETPVVAEAVLVLNDQNRLEITQLGTPRFFFPGFSYVAINNMLKQLLEQESIKKEFSLPNSENLQIRDVQFQQDKLYLNIFVDVNLF